MVNLCNNRGMLASPEQMAKLVELFRQEGYRQIYRKGEFIIRPGESSPGVFYIDSGIVKAYDITKYGEENLLILRKEKEIFPLIWGITGQERDIIYEALIPTTSLRVSQEIFVKFIKNHPGAMAPLLDMTVEMYRLHSERILNLEYRTVRQRLISFLLTMSQRFGKQTRYGLLLEVPLKHQDIASSINATRETTSRELSALERKKLLTNRHSHILLTDTKALRSQLG
jgi:CRP-like cAMP-binding protein